MQAQLTTETINKFYDHEEWGGFGYLGERYRQGTREDLVKTADELLLEIANAEGWTEDELFAYCNSTTGRHYGDMAFGYGFSAHAKEELRIDVRRCNLIHRIAVR